MPYTTSAFWTELIASVRSWSGLTPLSLPANGGWRQRRLVTGVLRVIVGRQAGDRGGLFLVGGQSVHGLPAMRTHLPAQHQRSLAARAGALEACLAPRAEDKVGLDALLAHRARVVDLDALQERLFFER